MRHTGRSDRHLAPLVAAIVAIALSLGALVACGDDDDPERRSGEQEVPTTLLDRGLHRPIDSANVSLDVQLQLDGLRGLDAPIRLTADGVYVRGERALPAVDVDFEVGNPAAGQSIQSGLVSTGSRAFVKFGGELYEQPRASIGRAEQRLRGGSSRGLGIDPGRWVIDARREEDEEIAGIPTDHVTATLAARRMLGDLDRLARRGRGDGDGDGGSAGQIPLVRLADYVGEPSIDAYFGKRDGLLRRISTTIELDVPEGRRAELNGLEGGSLRLTLELSKVNGGQEVTTPARVRPIADLAEQLGGAAALRRGLGGALGSGGESDGKDGGDPGADRRADSLQRYSDCIDRAPPSDTRAITRCRRLLE